MYLNINDFTLYYEEYGKQEAPNIVILPGWGQTRETFKYIIASLENDYKIYIVDYPGFGNSPFPHRDLTIYDYANLIIDFLNIKNIHNPIIIAHSFGGRIAIVLNGYLHQSIKQLILIGSAGIKPKKTWYQKLRQLTYKLLKNCQFFVPKKKRKTYLNKLLHYFGSTDFQQLNPNERQTFINIVNEDLKPYLKGINVATLLIWGENDTSTPLKDGQIMAKEIADAGLVVLRGCEHFCYLEEPSVVLKIIRQFLEG